MPCTPLICLLSLACRQDVAAKQAVVSSNPAQPTQGGSIAVTYDTKAPDAVQFGEGPVYALVMAGCTDHSSDKHVVELTREGGRWTGTLPVQKNASRLMIYFIAKSGPDRRNMLSETVLTADGKPGRDAIGSALDEHYKENLAKELAAYPDNVYAYRAKWFAESAYDKANLEKDIRADLPKIENCERTPDCLATLSYAYMTLKDEPKSRETLKELIAKYPSDPLVEIAISNYGYGVYSNQIQGAGPAEIDELEKQLILKNPAQIDFRSQVWQAGATGRLPLETIEAGCGDWIKAEPNNPQPYEALARAYLRAGSNPQKSAEMFDKALDLYIQGENRLTFDNFGSLESFTVPSVYSDAAKAYAANHQWAKAVSSVKMAESLDKSLGFKALLVEGKIWEDIGNTSKAQLAYEEAYRRGGKGAEQPLKALYARRVGSENDFPAYLTKLATPVNGKTDSGPVAPKFSVKSLDNQAFDLAKLKGKVVVLNFWFIGCAPCRVEMPHLNSLVKQYAANKDVVFIGFATDDAQHLKQFLAKTPFAYHVVPEASALASKYGVGAYPSHIVIGRDGRISSQSAGGSADIDQSLKIRIDRALAAGPGSA